MARNKPYSAKMTPTARKSMRIRRARAARNKRARIAELKVRGGLTERKESIGSQVVEAFKSKVQKNASSISLGVIKSMRVPGPHKSAAHVQSTMRKQ